MPEYGQARIGIDPGLTGAIALDQAGKIQLFDMPTLPRRTGKGNEVNARGLYLLLDDVLHAHYDAVCALESVHAMPGQGVTSMFSLGRSMGVVEGVLAALAIETVHVQPAAWKRRAGLLGKEKDASRTVAVALYPSMAENLSRKKDSGRADALLILRYGFG